jgi:RimJ/RimL family protein N-acetyltransferase
VAGVVHPFKGAFQNARIESSRLILRTLVFPDRDALSRQLSNAAIARWLARVPIPFTVQDAQAFIDYARLAAVEGTALTLVVTLHSRPWELVGIVASHSLDNAPEFGYWLAEPLWGKGLMTEASFAALDYLAAHTRLASIASGAFAGNHASLAIQRRLGFVETGTSSRENAFFNCHLDHIDTRLDFADYRASRALPRMQG